MGMLKVAVGLFGAAAVVEAYRVVRDSDDPREKIAAGVLGVLVTRRCGFRKFCPVFSGNSVRS